MRSRIRTRVTNPPKHRAADEQLALAASARNPMHRASTLMAARSNMRGLPPATWIPAVSNMHATKLATFVLHTGGSTGWLYNAGTLPKLVSIIATQPGGPTGMLVRVSPTAGTLSANPGQHGHYGTRYRHGLAYGNPDGRVPNQGHHKSGYQLAQHSRGANPLPVPFPGPGSRPLIQNYVGSGWSWPLRDLFPTEGAFIYYLKALGFNASGLHVLTAANMNAVRGFQAHHPPLVQDGLIGINTISALHGPVVALLQNGWPRYQPRTSGVGRRTSGATRNPIDSTASAAIPGDDPTAGCCFVESSGTYINPATGISTPTAGFVRCPGGEAQWYMHDRPIPTVTVGFYDDAGVRMAMVETGDGSFSLPVCGDSPPPPPPGDGGCCIDRAGMWIVCAEGHPWNGATVTQLLEVTQGGLQSFLFIDPADGQEKGTRLMPCDAPPPPPPPGSSCCYDATMQILVCDAGDPRDGVAVTVQSSFIDPQGIRIVVVRLPDGSALDVMTCEQPPDQCCYDVATGTLRCPRNDGLNGQQVSLIAMTQQPGGDVVAVVQIQGQSGVSTFPVCDDRVSECCYDATTQTISCPSDAGLNGTSAAIMSSWIGPDGAVWVWAVWPGGGSRMPLCPGQRECPPVFCCVNVETMKFVCPGRTDVNGRTANVVSIETDNGFNWGVLADGTRVALCGRECPPPEMCPDCPGCPPGMWMSPDGTCQPPPKCPPPGQCPTCPPGMLLNTQTGECVRCGSNDPCPPYPGRVIPAPFVPRRMAAPRIRAANPKKPCCDDCAKKKISNCSDCGGKKKAPNPSKKIFGRRGTRR